MGLIRGSTWGCARLVGQLQEDAAGHAPEGDALGEDHVGVPQHKHHVVLVGRVLDHPDLVRHDCRAMVARCHFLRRRCCTRTLQFCSSRCRHASQGTSCIVLATISCIGGQGKIGSCGSLLPLPSAPLLRQHTLILLMPVPRDKTILTTLSMQRCSSAIPNPPWQSV